MIAALTAVVLAANPCAPPTRTAPDAALAAVYEQVAREEGARGAREAATVAWIRAAELQTEGGSAAAALTSLCAFDLARPLLDEGRCVDALPLLAIARKGPDEHAAAELAHACTDGGDAMLSVWGRLKPTDPTVRRRAQKDRLALELAAEAGFDSNATLVPLTMGAGASDGFAAGTALVGFRPFGPDGPFAQLGAGYRKQFFFPASDVGLAAGTVGWEHLLGPVRASLDYGLDTVGVGGAPWLLRHRGTASALAQLGAVHVGAEYSLRHEQLWAASAAGDSGLRHVGEAELGFAAGGRVAGIATGSHVFGLAGVVQRAAGVTADRSFTEAGAELRETARSPSGRLVLDVVLGLRWRGYDAIDADLGVLRRETQGDLRAVVEYALDTNIAFYGAVDLRVALSSVPELSFARWNASAGLRVRVDLW